MTEHNEAGNGGCGFLRNAAVSRGLIHAGMKLSAPAPGANTPFGAIKQADAGVLDRDPRNWIWPRPRGDSSAWLAGRHSQPR